MTFKKVHGQSLSPEWVTWRDMRHRCTKPHRKEYPRYGGRGITVCDRWNSFANFIADMGLRPSRKHTLDRINNDGNYEPGNCRWATRLVQNRNKSNVSLKPSPVSPPRMRKPKLTATGKRRLVPRNPNWSAAAPAK